jgi:predicted methyltransferase
MKYTLLLAALALGCSPAVEQEPPQSAPPPSAPPQAASSAEPAPPPPSAEELAAAEEQKKLAAEFVELDADNTAELQRLTPELRAKASKLVATGGGTRTKLKAAIASPHRRPTHVERDAARHPLETLEFLGLNPYQKVLEYGPGEGYYTELLGPVLYTGGKLYVTQPDPNGQTTARPTLYGKRTELFLAALPEVYGKVERSRIDPDAPKLALEDKSLDTVLMFRTAHGMVNNGVLSTWLAEFHRVLKARGTLGVEQHRAPVGADVPTSSKKGYLPEAFLIEQIEAAGFKLLQKSEINANPKDTKDHPEGVWNLPPSLRGGDVDREKYVAIGESDRMTLRFVKVEKKAAPAPKPAATPTTPAAAPPAAPTGGAPAAPAPKGAAPPTGAAPATAPAAPAASGN